MKTTIINSLEDIPKASADMRLLVFLIDGNVCGSDFWMLDLRAKSISLYDNGHGDYMDIDMDYIRTIVVVEI